jgi:hypothetical protein
MALYTVNVGDGSTLSSLDVSAGRGPKGDTGDAGPIGPIGPQGDAGTNITITVATDQAAFDASTPAATELVVLYA